MPGWLSLLLPLVDRFRSDSSAMTALLNTDPGCFRIWAPKAKVLDAHFGKELRRSATLRPRHKCSWPSSVFVAPPDLSRRMIQPVTPLLRWFWRQFGLQEAWRWLTALASGELEAQRHRTYSTILRCQARSSEASDQRGVIREMRCNSAT